MTLPRAKGYDKANMVFMRLCASGKCRVEAAQEKTSEYVEVNGEIATRPVWRCICCGHIEKRIVRKSAKSKDIEVRLNAWMEKHKASMTLSMRSI